MRNTCEYPRVNGQRIAEEALETEEQKQWRLRLEGVRRTLERAKRGEACPDPPGPKPGDPDYASWYKETFGY